MISDVCDEMEVVGEGGRTGGAFLCVTLEVIDAKELCMGVL